MAGTQKPICFVIAPIGPKDSDIRKRSDKVLKHIFRKALAEKYDVVRGDEIEEPGMITSQVLRAVQEAPLVVADLTGHNPNVLYELAVRHAIEKPIIHAIEPKLSKIPFDIAGFRTIEFDLTDPDSIESAVEQLTKQTDQAEKGKWGETPVKLANIMRRSKEDSKDTVLLKQAVEGIAALRASVVQLSTQMTDQLERAEFNPTRYFAVPSIGAKVNLSDFATGYPGVAPVIGLNHPVDALQFQTPDINFAANEVLKYASQPDEVPPPPKVRRRMPRPSSGTLRAIRRREEGKE